MPINSIGIIGRQRRIHSALIPSNTNFVLLDDGERDASSLIANESETNNVKDLMSFIIEKFAKNTHYSFFSIELIITTIYIPRNCAPQIKANKETCNFVERHHDPLWKKKKFICVGKIKDIEFLSGYNFSIDSCKLDQKQF